MKDIFISYSSKETDEAIKIRDVLETNGISCWMAPRDIPSGSNYAKEIPVAIKTCRLFLLVFSQNAQESLFVPKELDIAVSNGKIIIPVVLEDCPMSEEFNFLLTGSQRFLAFQKKSEVMETLVREVQRFLGIDTGFVPPKDTSKDTPKDITRDKTKQICVAIILAVVLAAVPFLIQTIENWFEQDERRHAAERAEYAACGYAESFLWDTGRIHVILSDAIDAAREELALCTEEYAVVEDFSIRQYREQLYNNVIIFPNLISDYDAEYIYGSDFEPEFAIDIHKQTIGYLEEGKTLLDDLDNILRLNTTLTTGQKLSIIDYLEQYSDLVAEYLELQTNQFLLPLRDETSLEEIFVSTEEVVGRPPLLRDSWSDDSDYLENRCNEVYKQLGQLGKLLSDDSALLDAIGAQNTTTEN